MEHLADAASWLLEMVRPWPAIFAFDLGRYLLAATLFSVIIVLAPLRAAAFRRARRSSPKPNQTRHELRHSVISAGIFALVGLGVYHGVAGGVFRVYSQVAEHGWLYWAATIALIIVAHDTYFYWTHRWMHSPMLFRRVHRTHHMSVAPTVWAAYSFSIYEAILQAVFLPLFLLLVPTHESVLFVWIAHQILRNVAGHCGVELEPKTWLGSWWGRSLTTTLHHDMHHQHGHHNYGLYFAWWDRWCGTEHPEYRVQLATLLRNLSEHEPQPDVAEKPQRSHAGMLLVLCVASLGSLIISRDSHGSELIGEWATQGNAAHVRIEPCEGSLDTLCGVITWLWEPINEKGEPIHDDKNPDPVLRKRPLIGVSLLKDFHRDANGKLSGGQIYNPENGRTYRSSMKLRSEDILEVKGCLLFVCDTQVWRRADSVCKALPQNRAQD